ELIDERGTSARDLEYVRATVDGIVGAGHEAFLLETVDEMSHGGQGRRGRLAGIIPTGAWMGGHVDEGLVLRVGQVELGGPLPEELSEDRAPKRVEKVEELLSLRSPLPAARTIASRRHRIMVHPLNS